MNDESDFSTMYRILTNAKIEFITLWDNQRIETVVGDNDGWISAEFDIDGKMIKIEGHRID